MTEEKINDGLTPSEKQQAQELIRQEQEIKAQIDFQQQMYNDKQKVEVLGVLLAALEKVDWKDGKLRERVESKFYNKLMEFATAKENKDSKLLK